MKILDRYVVASFLKNYLIAFFVLNGMYVSLDMVFNFDELVQVQEKAGEKLGGVESALLVVRAAADYYFYQIFYIFVQLSGMIPVVAACFTMIRLSRFNELSAIMAAGVPLLRVAFPVIIAGIILNALMLADQELLIPEIIPKLVRSRQEAGQQTTGKDFAIPAMQDDQNGVLNVARYKSGPGNPIMYELTLIEKEIGPDGQPRPVSRLIAKRADWDPAAEHWALSEGMRIGGLRANEPMTIDKDVKAYKSSITPTEINLYKQGNYVEMLSTARIEELLERPKSYGAAALQRAKHSRFTQPLVNIILLLLAIPCVLTRQPAQLRAAATKCLLLTGACMGLTFLAQQMAGSTPLIPSWAAHWPALMAWMPVLVFGPIAVWLLDRVET